MRRDKDPTPAGIAALKPQLMAPAEVADMVDRARENSERMTACGDNQYGWRNGDGRFVRRRK